VLLASARVYVIGRKECIFKEENIGKEIITFSGV